MEKFQKLWLKITNKIKLLNCLKHKTLKFQFLKLTGCLNTKCVFYFDYGNDTISN